jgi:hypothetical protein
MKREYDFTGGERGKYASRVASMARVVTLEPEIAAVFNSSEAVNDALRPLAKLIKQTRKPPRRRKAG